VIAAVLGWVGTAGTFGAYVLLSRGRWHAMSIRYAALNFVAGLSGAVGMSLYGAWPSVISNLLWAGIAACSIASTYRQRRGARSTVPAPAEPRPEPPTGDLPVLARAA
jgi:hypothetical protein